MKRSCDTCEWWERCERNEGWGVCYGAPPSALPGGTAVWPVTPAEKRCGSWRLAEAIIQAGPDPEDLLATRILTVTDARGRVVGKVPVGWGEDDDR